MIKQIQLRGISRTPSDRMTADGGCAESLNIHIEEGESAPTLPAKDVSEAVGLTDGEAPIYIHNTLASKNLILIKAITGGVGIYARLGAFDNILAPIFESEHEDYTVKDIRSVGNTLIAATNYGMMYALFKDGKYIYLGDRIPMPEVEMRTMDTNVLPHAKSREVFPPPDLSEENYNYFMWTYGQSENSGPLIDRIRVGQTDGEAAEVWIAMQKYVLDAMRNYPIRLNGEMCANLPVYARYAVKLYDGSYIYQSAPVLLGGGYEEYFYAYIERKHDDVEDKNTYHERIKSLRPLYYALCILRRWDGIDNWKDVVNSIDVFITPFVAIPNSDAIITETIDNYVIRREGDYTFYESKLVFEGDDANYVEKRLLAVQDTFCKVYSAKIGETQEIENGVNLFSNSDVVFTENLLTQENLNDGYLSQHKYIPEDLLTYNNRLLSWGGNMELYKGDKYSVAPAVNFNTVNASVTTPDYGSIPQVSYRFKWYILKNGVTYSVVSNSVPFYQYQYFEKDYEGGDKRHNGRSFTKGWLCYPDPDCNRVDVEVTSTLNGTTTVTAYTAEMKRHPKLSAAYLYWGLDNEIGVGNAWSALTTYTVSLTGYTNKLKCIKAVSELLSISMIDAKDIVDNHLPYVVLSTSSESEKDRMVAALENGTGTTSVTTGSSFDDSEKKYYESDNVIKASPVDNPFYFPASGYIRMFSGIIGVAAVTIPLSQGQAGQFDLYVFTRDGVYAIQSSADGSLLSTHAVTREVAINDQIFGFEQAVVFVSDKGVMLLQGMQVTNLSPGMNGRHYVLENDVKQLLEGDNDWSGVVPSITDNEPFMAFMRKAKIGYDYKGGRLIFFNDEKPYQYVYMLGTQTWHKMLEGLKSRTVLNSYPDCMVADSTPVSVTKYIVTITAGTSGSAPQSVRRILSEWLTDNGIVTYASDLASLPCSIVFYDSELADEFTDDIIPSAEYQPGDIEYSTSEGTDTRIVSHLFDYSTALEDADVLSDQVSPVRGIIITRPFDLGEADVRKSINHIRIRGQYNRNDVQYILCGSMDGINWKILGSLRGGSYKLFRMVILANLAPTERISWIDIDFETRFTNRLR